MHLVPATVTDRHGVTWLYQYGHLYADPTGRIVRHIESLR